MYSYTFALRSFLVLIYLQIYPWPRYIILRHGHLAPNIPNVHTKLVGLHNTTLCFPTTPSRPVRVQLLFVFAHFTRVFDWTRPRCTLFVLLFSCSFRLIFFFFLCNWKQLTQETLLMLSARFDAVFAMFTTLNYGFSETFPRLRKSVVPFKKKKNTASGNSVHLRVLNI